MTSGAGLHRGIMALSCGAILSLAACEQWHLSVNGDGLLLVSVIGDNSHPRDRFRVRTRDSNGVVRIRDLPSSGRLTLSPTAAGSLELTLLPPEGCTVAGPNPQLLTVAAGTSVRVSFDVRCE
jgi:hypothetical protein